MKLIKTISLCLLASVLSSGGADAFAQNLREFSFVNSELMDWGTGLLENYDVAIHLAGNGLSSTEVNSISMQLAGIEELSDIRLWLSRDLTLDGKVNMPDIGSYDVSPEDGRVSVDLEAPINVGEQGLYVGCSFGIAKLTAETKAPLMVSSPGCPGSFFIHSSRKYSKWDSYGLDLALAMTVTLSGDFHDSDVEVSECFEGNSIAGDFWTPQIVIRNLGTVACKDIEYELIIDGNSSGVASITLDEPLLPDYGRPLSLSLPGICMEDSGSHDWNIKVLKVNGLPNMESSDSASGELYVWPYAPEHTPLMEEYTGTWCGWCPRGAVGLEAMQEKYGEKFVAMAYHTDSSKDAMATSIKPTTDYEGAPWGVLDRCDDADPFYGHLDYCESFKDGIEAAWLERKEVKTPFEISGSACWTDETMDRLLLKSEALSVRDFRNSDIRIGYFLIADGLKGETKDWIQSNYYSGLDQYKEGDLSLLYGMPKYMVDWKFNHVLVYTPDAYGSANSLPADIEALKHYSHMVEIPLDAVVNEAGESLVQDKTQLHVVIAVIDAGTNTVLNSRYIPITRDGAGILTSVQIPIDSIEYLDLQGIRISDNVGQGNSKTPVIKITTFADGKIKAERVLIR